ncbi:MAG TPA: DUF541 domain-containing protein [Alphaproteobacteria bacterium]|nr:DUF541 domain-containing protein [Alphaproteobacteria bacterium]
MRQFLVGLLILCVHFQVSAQDSSPTYDRINLSISAEREIENDLLIASLYAQEEALRQSEVADRINTTMQWALEMAHKVRAVQVQTARYNTYPVNDRNNRITGWRGRQALRLQSPDVEALTQLLGTLQQQLAIESVTYGISRAARDAAEESLITEVIAQFRKRAELVTSEMGRIGYRVVDMHIDTQQSRPPPVPYQARALTMEADIAAPVVELGVRAVIVSISATIELDPPR